MRGSCLLSVTERAEALATQRLAGDLTTLASGPTDASRREAGARLQKELLGPINVLTERWATDARATDALIAALGDSDDIVRVHAATCLGRAASAYRAEARIGAALDPFLDHPSRGARTWAIEGVLATGEESSLDLVLPLSSHADASTREALMSALIRFSISHPPSAPRRAQLCAAFVGAVGDAKRDVRIAGASGLRRVGDASALGPLKATLKKADTPIEREALRDAIKALAP